MPEDHHHPLAQQPAHTSIFSSSKESMSNAMALHVSHHNGSENCDPNLISGSLKRKLKSSSTSAVVTVDPGNQIVSRLLHKQQTQEIVSGVQAMASSILTSPPRKTQHLMCSSPKANPNGGDAYVVESGTKILEINTKMTEIDIKMTEIDAKCPSICTDENRPHADKEGSGSDQGSITPEKTGNWRLRAVLEEFGPDLTPTRQGRVKTLVRAFEKLMSSKNKEAAAAEEEEAERAESKSKPREFPLQFTYLNPKGCSVGLGHGSDHAVEAINTDEQHREELLDESTCEGEHRISLSRSEGGWKYSPRGESMKSLKDQQSKKNLVPKPKAPYFTSQGWRKPQLDASQKSLRLSSAPTTCSILHRKQPEARSVHVKARVSKPRPFKLATEERGKTKKEEFLAKLKQIVAEEERLRIPLAQGLPLTTDEPEIPPKPMVKESTVPDDIHLNTDLRAMERAEFDQYISEKLLYLENRRLEEERLRMMAEEEEIKRLRQEMVPKAQMMPYFDRPFRPRRSSKRPTIPREPRFHHKSWTNNSSQL